MTVPSAPDVPSPPLTREQVDDALTRLGERYERLATAMYALDTRPGQEFLRTSQVTGATLALREQMETRGAVLWAQFSALGEMRERATQTRARRGRPGEAELSELTLLLCDPVVGLDGDGIPVAGSGVLPATRVRLDDLATVIETGCVALTGDVDRLDAAVTAAVQRITPMTDNLAAADSLADDLGMGLERGLAPLADELAELRERVLDDPLSGAADSTIDARLRRLATEIDAGRDRFATLDRLRRAAPQRLAAAATRLDELVAAEVATEAAYRATREKIAGAGLPALPDRATALRGELDAVTRCADDQDWGAFGELLSAWERAVAQATTRAGELRDAVDGLLARRTELRGRLQAYQSKAARLGVVEEETVAARYTEARQLLWTSPCDLRAATRAVLGYQQAIATAGEQT